jgi:hypothetical protein
MPFLHHPANPNAGQHFELVPIGPNEAVINDGDRERVIPRDFVMLTSVNRRLIEPGIHQGLVRHAKNQGQKIGPNMPAETWSWPSTRAMPGSTTPHNVHTGMAFPSPSAQAGRQITFRYKTPVFVFW